jgi:LacI family transcriptional regulator
MSVPPIPDPRRPQRHIGLFISPELELGRRIMAGFSDYALKHPEWILWPVHAGWEEAHKAASIHYDAVIAFMARPDSDAIFRPWWPRVVNVSSKFDTPDYARVVTDDAAVGRLAARHFLDRGFRQFAAVGMAGTRFSEQRLQGFRAELRKAGIAEPRLPMHLMDTQLSSSAQTAALEDFMEALSYPVGLFADSDWTAFKVRRICFTRDIQVPGELAILGVDNDPYICQLGNAALSSIELDGAAIGRAAGEWIERGFQTGKWPKKPQLVPPVGVVERLSTEHTAVDDPLLRKALQFIRTQAVMGAGVEELCQHLAVTRKTLDRRFQAHAGKSPHELILQRRVEYARRLLRETDEKLEAVAYGSGFNDVRTFSRVFSRHEDATPAAYRKRFR